MAMMLVVALPQQAFGQAVPHPRPTATTVAQAGVAFADRCDVRDAALSLVGHLPDVDGSQSIGFARLVDDAAGAFVIEMAPRSFAEVKQMRDASADGTISTRAIVAIDNERIARARALGSTERQLAEIHRMTVGIKAFLPAFRNAKVLTVGATGDFRCDGLVPGTFRLIGFVRQRVVVVNHTSTPGVFGFRTKMYAARIVVPKPRPREHLVVRVPALTLIGDNDPND